MANTIAIAMALTSPSLSLPRLLPSPSLPSLSLPPSLSFAPSLSLSAHFLARAAAPDLGRRIDFEPEDPLPLPLQDIGGAGPGSGNGAGSGGGGGGGESEDFDEEEEEDEAAAKNKMLMSQKFTLAYAALVGAGGIIGFLKKGSLKSAAAGGLSSLLLFYVYTQLPVNPTFASSLGLGISGALLVVMGSRFKKSGKMFPAGVVSLVSLFMTGGYLHAILRAH